MIFVIPFVKQKKLTVFCERSRSETAPAALPMKIECRGLDVNQKPDSVFASDNKWGSNTVQELTVSIKT